MPTQKKYNTVAAQYYRSNLRRSLDQQKLLVEREEPDYEEGRRPM
jgi:hypothetical protein